MRKDIRGGFRLVVWLPPLVGRRAIFLLSFVIFAFAGSGRRGVDSSGSGTLDSSRCPFSARAF